MSAPILRFSDFDAELLLSPEMRSGPAPCDPVLERRQALLALVVETEIVPRLLSMNQERRPSLDSALPFTPHEINAFSDKVLAASTEELEQFVRHMRDHAPAIVPLLTNLLAPAARHLGDLWNDDLCDFLDVTIAMSKLKRLIAAFQDSSFEVILDPRHRALLLCLPGEQHLFGLEIVAEAMRLAAGAVVIAKGDSATGQAALIRRDWFGICGLTLSAPAGLAETARTIGMIRQASLNRNLGVLVGGKVFVGQPQLAAQVGADAAPEDARAAVLAAAKLVRDKHQLEARDTFAPIPS